MKQLRPNLALLLLGISALTVTARANNNTLVVDKWSADSLSMTYDGVTVWGAMVADPFAEFWEVPVGPFGLNVTADSVDSMGNVTAFGTADDLFSVGWLVPGGSGEYNYLDGVGWGNGGYPLVTNLQVAGDFTGLPEPATLLADGTTYSDGILPFAVQFNDHGDGADAAPDGGPTWAMMAVVLAGFCLRRRAIRSASGVS